jgi:hypothetical protein
MVQWFHFASLDTCQSPKKLHLSAVIQRFLAADLVAVAA